VLAGSPADFGKFIGDETEKCGKVIKFAGRQARVIRITGPVTVTFVPARMKRLIGAARV